MEKEYWKDPDVLSPGIEGIILRPMITLKRNTLPKASSEMRHLLRGVRWLLLVLLRLGATEPLSKTVEFIANYLKLCQELPILVNGFRDTVTIFADRNGILNVWAEVLEQVGNFEEPLPKVCDLLDPYLDQFYLQEDKNSISILWTSRWIGLAWIEFRYYKPANRQFALCHSRLLCSGFQ